MHPQEKMAWYMLAVVLLVVSVIVSVSSMTGQWHGALRYVGLLGLLGLGGLFGTGRINRQTMDERDFEIQSKARSAGFWGFWFCYVAGWIFLQQLYEISIPQEVFSLWFWLGVVVFIVVQALAMVVLYRSDSSAGSTPLDWYRGLSMLQKRGLVGFFWMLVLLVVFTFPFLEVGSGEKPLVAGFAWDALFAAMYLLVRREMARYAASESDRLSLAEARKIGDRTALVALAGALAGVFVVWLMPVEVNLMLKIPQTLFFVVMTGSLGLTLAVLLKRDGSQAGTDKTSTQETTNA